MRVIKSRRLSEQDMWHVWGREKVHTWFWWRDLREGGHLEYLICSWEDNIKMDLREVGRGGMGWFIWLRVETAGGLL
jgi:hypothetical protein